MTFGKPLVVFFALTISVICKVNDDKINTLNKNSQKDALSYAGEHFPDKYLEEDIASTAEDLDNYIDGVSKVVNYFSSLDLNKTADFNKALGLYFMRGNIKRTIMDYSEALNIHQQETLLDILNKAAIIWSYFVSGIEHDFSKLEYRFPSALSDPMTLAYSVGDFKGNSLRKWIKRQSSVNTFLEDMDKKLLCRTEYQRLMYLLAEKYHIRIKYSDFCILKIAFNPEPINMTGEMTPCKPDPVCYKAISSNPSIAYTLSHRVVNLIMYRMTRRCYFDAADRDEAHIESLCAQMYRESVYIARRGFFARDMFMEHVALCTMMGYKEFFRRNWFNKMLSWIDEDGCIAENINFSVNRTVMLKNIFSKVNINVDRELKRVLITKCGVHVMSVFLVAMSSAIRGAAHHVAASGSRQPQPFGPYWVSPVAKIKHI